jgi:hypothetical protein
MIPRPISGSAPRAFLPLPCIPLLGMLVAAGCEAPMDPGASADHPASHGISTTQAPHAASSRPAVAQPEVSRALAQVRRATAPFHRLEQAEAAGWDTDITGCMEHPELGGMGHHYANLELLDDKVELERPEALLYAPHNGDMRLVAVEYIVPFEAWEEPDPPSLFGRHFMANEAFQVWALHAWIWRDNPAGIFADWNPRVSCP